MYFFVSGVWDRTEYVIERSSGWRNWFDVVLIFELRGTDALAGLSKVDLYGSIT